jgi:hypothetical protein
MTLLPVADGARLLGIHPKTLHYWLKEANMSLAIHPTDARIKCVSEEHLQQVASLHGRSLQSPAQLDTASPPLVPSQMQTLPVPANGGEPASPACLLPTPHVPDAELIKTTGLPGKQARHSSGANRPAGAGAPSRAGEIGRTSHQHPGVPYATIHGKTDAESASSRGEKRACLPGTAASTTPSRRPPGSVSQASSDRIQRAGGLCDH